MKRPILATTALALAAVVAGLVMAGSSVAASSLPTLTLTLNGKAVTAGGQMVSGAVNIQTTVTGEAQGEPALIYLDPGVPYSVVPKLKAEIQAHNGDFNYLDGYGSMVFDAAANKGTSSEQTVLKPGNYLALDLNGKNAMPAPFTVTAAASPATLPARWSDDRLDRVQLHRRDDAARRRARPVRERRLPVPHDPGAGVKSAAAGRKVMALLLAGKDNAAGKLAISERSSKAVRARDAIGDSINELPGYHVIRLLHED